MLSGMNNELIEIICSDSSFSTLLAQVTMNSKHYTK